MKKENWRKTEQYLMPVNKEVSAKGKYDLYPTMKIEDGKITQGFEFLAQLLVDEKRIIIDGYMGVFFENFKSHLQEYFDKCELKVNWMDVSTALKTEAEIDKMIAPFLGGDDPVFGSRTTLNLIDFYQSEKIKNFKSDENADLNIVYGVGASLTGKSNYQSGCIEIR